MKIGIAVTLALVSTIGAAIVEPYYRQSDYPDVQSSLKMPLPSFLVPATPYHHKTMDYDDHRIYQNVAMNNGYKTPISNRNSVPAPPMFQNMDYMPKMSHNPSINYQRMTEYTTRPIMHQPSRPIKNQFYQKPMMSHFQPMSQEFPSKQYSQDVVAPRSDLGVAYNQQQQQPLPQLTMVQNFQSQPHMMMDYQDDKMMEMNHKDVQLMDGNHKFVMPMPSFLQKHFSAENRATPQSSDKVLYSPATAVSHVSFNGMGAKYEW